MKVTCSSVNTSGFFVCGKKQALVEFHEKSFDVARDVVAMNVVTR